MDLMWVERFRRDVLPGLVAGKRSLHAVFVTGGWMPEAKPVPAKRPGLRITVQSGSLRYAEADMRVEPLLGVICAGLAISEEALAFVESLRRDQPNADIVLLTCDCDLARKRSLLHPLVRDGCVDHVLVTPDCGGGNDMADLLAALIAAWSAAA